MNCRIRPLFMLPALVCGAALASPSSPDARIEAAVKRSYTFKVNLKDDTINVKSEKGTVTLTGTVADSFHRSLAEETVADLPGVKSVVNLLTIQGAAPSEASDAWLVTKVKAALLYHRNVDAPATKVDCKDGVVTLSGGASSTAQKELTASVARDVDGVKSVVNNLEVTSSAPKKPLSAKIDDASVTAQVKASLLFHKGTHMLATRVKTDRGVVTVRGTAKNAAEKDLVTRLVAGINGVKRVDNRMTIE